MKKKLGAVDKALDKDLERQIAEIRTGSRKVMSSISQEYLAMMADPKRAKPCRSPTPNGGFVGRTGLSVMKVAGTFACGTQGVGCVAWSPRGSGPYSDRAACLYTDATNTMNGVSSLPTSTGVGITALYWSQSPYTAAGSNATFLQYRPVASAIYVYPRGAATAQSGDLYLHESPAHSGCTTFNALFGHRVTRAIRGVQVGSAETELCLNWHPVGYTVGDGADDFGWSNQSSAVSSIAAATLAVAAVGAAGTDYHFEIYSVYEVVGSQASGLKAQLMDSRGMDLICAVIASKTISGWVAKPHHAQTSYLAQAWGWAKKLGQGLRNDLEGKDSVVRQLGSLVGTLF